MSAASIRPDSLETPELPEEPPERGLPRRAAPPLANAWGRPPGWLGWWSERYAHVIDRYLFPRRPFEATELARALAAAPPMPFAETLDPIASDGEPRDRDGTLLPWRFARSATSDLFGNWGVAFGMLTVGLVILNFSISHTVVQPPTGKDNVPAQTGAPRGGETAAPSRPVNPSVTDILPSPSEQRPLNAANPANPADVNQTPQERKDRGPNWPQGQPQQQQPQGSQADRKSAVPNENPPPSNVAPSRQKVVPGGDKPRSKVPKS